LPVCAEAAGFTGVAFPIAKRYERASTGRIRKADRPFPVNDFGFFFTGGKQRPFFVVIPDHFG
jgi:hypothetical protein